MLSNITPSLPPADALVAVADYFAASARYHARFAAKAVADGDLELARKAAARATADVAAFNDFLALVPVLPTREL
jgi:hypothetical protein